jgi:uncharacterized protein YutE (UPF0331/DUF86 family)
LVETETVLRRLEIIHDRLQRLDEAAAEPYERYADDTRLQSAVERDFQVLIQASIDLALHVLADFSAPMPESYRGAFRALADQGLLEDDLAVRLEEMAAFRNVLVHGYAAIDAAAVHANLAHLPDVRRYLERLAAHLRQQDVWPES